MTSDNQPDNAVQPAPSQGVIVLPPYSDALATDAAKSVPMTPPPETQAADWSAKVDWVLLGLLVGLAALVSSVPAFNADVWMHLATGKLMAQRQYLPGDAEPFSCATEAGAGHDATPWINHSWLYSLGLYLLYGALGGAGVIVVKAVLVAVLTVVLMLIRTGDTPRFILATCLTLTVLALSMRLLLQPVIVSYLFLGVTLLVLQRSGVWDRGSATAAPDPWWWLCVLPVLCLIWVNLDNWFILGPLVVGLSWVGLAVQRWRGWSTRVRPGQLGMVFGACVLACLINPFHVRAFQLPPELAYLLVRGGDRIGVSLPDALVAGGRTLSILHQDDPSLPITLSPFARSYLSSPTLGYTIAGVCFYPLLGLGLVSFLVNGVLSGKPGGPVVQPARFLVWLFFAVLASLLQRLIPFFVIVGGPILALNLGDLLAWYMQPAAGAGGSAGGSAGGAPPVWAAPLRLGRLVGVLVLIALGLLAWPGWLTGPRDIGGRLHAGWDIPVNESLRRAAQALTDAARPSGQPARVFSTGPDFACYCAYFAGPGKIKGFIDNRYNLFPSAAADYVKVVHALTGKDKQRLPLSEWQGVFEAHQLDHVAVEGFLNTPTYASWWGDPGRWRQRWADRALAVFAWSGEGRHWPGDALLDNWNRLAFGPVAPADRPPADGVPDPVNRTLLDRYLDPPPALPEAALDMDLKLAYGAFVTTRAREIAQLTLPNGLRSQLLPMYSLPLLPLAPGTMTAPWAMAAQLEAIEEHRIMAFFWNTPDALPPAVPILALRRAWQAAAEAPENERCDVYLANALTRVQQQEDYWVSPFSPPPVTLRTELRRVQVVSALRAATEVGFANAALQYQVYHELAQEYFRRHALDLSAEYLELAATELEAAMPEDPRVQESWRKEKKQLGEERKAAAAEVLRRKKAFDLKTAGRKPMEKIAEATYGLCRFFGKDNREEIDPEGWGLTGTALRLLDDTDPATLSPQERSQWGFFSIDLMFKVGRAREASQLLSNFETPLGPLALQYRIYRAATHGNYRALADALKEGDALRAERLSKVHRMMVVSCVSMIATPGPTAPTFVIGGTPQHWLDVVNAWRLSLNEAHNSKTLRGMIALEAGETAEAQRLFAAVLREAGDDFYTERIIAERYAAFLARYQPR